MRIAVRCALTAALFSCIGAARAADGQPTPDLAEEADLHFSLGVEAYRGRDYTAALEHLLLSNRLAPNRNVVYNIARAYEQLGRFPEAFRHYADYLEVEPDPARRAPAEEAIARLRPRVALVRVETDPPGATLYVDRRDLGPRGASPRVLALSPGAHTVFAEAEGYEPAAPTAVELAVGQERAVSLPMARVLGEIRVEGGPTGAEVRLDTEDGPVVGTVPGAFQLDPGSRVLVITAPGRRAERLPVDIAARSSRRVVVDLAPETGAVVVNAAERDALIELDGVSAGFTPTVLTAPVGPHRVRVTLPGFRPYETTVEVPVDGRVVIDARLRPVQEVTAASRTTQSLEDAPASVTLVTAEELRAFGHQTLADALAGLRGVTMTDDLTYASVGFRGLSALGGTNNHVLVTLDGHAMNDDQLGAAYLGHDLLPDLQDVERIEVVRGPGSALYGSNAFFGVVNLVTRSEGTTRRPHVTIAGDGARTGRARASASGAWGEDGGWWASAGGVASQGGDYVFPELADSVTGGVSEGADGSRAGGARGRLWKGDFTLQGYWNTRDKRIPTGPYGTLLADARARSADTRGFVEARWEPTLGDAVQLFGRAFLDRYHFRGTYPYDDAAIGVVEDLWDGTWTGAEARIVATPWAPLRLTGGVQADLHVQADLRGEDASGVYLDVAEPYQVLAGYAVADLDAGPVSASLGARVDHYSTFGTTLNPRLAVIVRPAEAHTLKLLAGRAFRAPTVYELFYNDDGASQIAAPNLGPETILTGEVEYTWRPTDLTSVVTSAYVASVEQLVDLARADGGVLQFRNRDGALRSVGGELEVRREWSQGWMLAVAQSAQQVGQGDLLAGATAMNVPAYAASVRGAVPLAAGVTGATRLRVETGRLTSVETRTPVAALWDLTLSGIVPAYRLDWAFGVRNVLDWEASVPGPDGLDQVTLPLPGRNLYAEVGYTF